MEHLLLSLPSLDQSTTESAREKESSAREEFEDEADKKRHLNVLLIGHVDAGKSTTAGQILFLSGQVDARTIQKLEKEAKDKNRESWYMAYIMDINEEERVKGKTVEVGRAHFETETSRFTILDAPGHKSYVGKMIGGASQADIGVLVISARKGEFETGYERGGQTREHVQLSKTFGVSKLLVVVNKMDDSTVKWSKERYDEIESKMLPFLRSSSYNVEKDVQFLPISGLMGTNMKTRLDKRVCPWWNGPCLFEALDAIEVPMHDPKGPFRLSVMDKCKDMGTVVMGKVESGSIREGDSMLIMPNKVQVKVVAILRNKDKVKLAGHGENLRVRVSGVEEEDIKTGCVLSSIPNPIAAVYVFVAQLQILESLGNKLFMVEDKATLHIHSVSEECEIVELMEEINPKTKKPKTRNPTYVKKGAVVVCRIQVNNLICVENFSDFPQLGRFTLRSQGPRLQAPIPASISSLQSRPPLPAEKTIEAAPPVAEYNRVRHCHQRRQSRPSLPAEKTIARLNHSTTDQPGDHRSTTTEPDYQFSCAVMDRYFKRKSTFSCDEQINENEVGDERVNTINEEKNENEVGEERVDIIGEESDVEFGDVPLEINVEDVRRDTVEFDVANLPSDPGLRIPINDYDFNVRDLVRRTYVQRGPRQPRNHEFPLTKFSKQDRRFCVSWYNEHSSWLEYSIAKDAVFCFYCYLFGSIGGSFVNGGFRNWKKKDLLRTHIAKSSSAHNQARVKYESFKNQQRGIRSCLNKQSHQARQEYRIRLNATLDCIRFLLRQGLASRGHDESVDSNNKGNFLELLHWLCDHNAEIRDVALMNAPENLKLTSPHVQRDLVSAIASEVINVIIKDLGYSLFSILIDESRDISMKEQMSVVFRYVKDGCVLEHFIGVTHVSSTTAASLKAGIDQLFSKYSLSMSNLRGQGYDGASNMRGEYNGLKALILKENPYAYYIHCFAHQLQLALVAVAQKHAKIETFFHVVHRLVNVVGGSAKRSDLLRERQRLTILEALNVGDISSGQGLHQETTLKRPGDTRWGSHYSCLINLIVMFSSTVEVIEMITTDSTSTGTRGEACMLLESMIKFDFAFSLHLMKKILGISNELSKSLQRKDQDIVNAMILVKLCKVQLQMMRDDGWNSFFGIVCSFCEAHEINVPNLDDKFIALGRSRRDTVTNLHHYRVEMFYAIIDMQLQELNDRFSEVNSDLLLCVACLSPSNSFASFEKNKLLKLCEYYPMDFDASAILELDDQLDTYILDMHTDEDFEGLHGLGDLAKKLVAKNKHQVHPLVYKLVTLALILPVATATVERSFSAMTYVKNRLRNRIGDQLLNDSLIAYIEKNVFDNIENNVIMEHYQRMKTRREQL